MGQKLITISAILLLIFTTQCQWNQKVDNHHRSLSSTPEEMEAGFLEALSRLQNTNLETLEQPFSSTLLNVIKRSYFYMEKFDVELDRIYRECIALRNSVDAQGDIEKQQDCEDPMNLPDYRKMMAARIIFERQKVKISYYYSRLLDLANFFDDSIDTVYAQTSAQMQTLNEEQQRQLSQDARQILTRWNTDLRDNIQVSTQTDGLISYELAIELFKTKEQATVDWSETAGKNFNPSSLLDSQSSLSDYYQSNRQQFDSEISAADSLEVEGLDEIIEELERSPNSSWKNYTGRSFARGQWALTYDDGPRAKTTSQLLSILQNKGWHATFFWLAKNAQSSGNKDVIARTKRLGMGLANHSYTHANLSKSSANLDKEIGQSKRRLESVYGQNVRFFRLPYGAGTKSSRVRNKIAGEGMLHFAWNVDSLDWKDPSPQSIVNRIRKQMSVQGRGIILMHDIHQKTVNATKILADNYNFNVVPLAKAIGQSASGGSAKPLAPFKAHKRRITSATLNVRTVAGVTSNQPCGSYAKGTVVTVIAQDPATGWYSVDTSRDRPNPAQGSGRQCPRDQVKAWISGGSRFTKRQ